MKQMIQVTRDHVARGIRGHWELCPVALALSDRTGWRWEIFGATAEYAPCVWEPTVRLPYRIDLPGIVRKFVNDFDDGTPVAPITYELDFPDDLIIREEPYGVSPDTQIHVPALTPAPAE